MAIDIIARAMAATAIQDSSSSGGSSSGEGCTCGEDHLLDSDIVTDTETEEALDEVFGDEATSTEEGTVATASNVTVDESKVATASEVSEVLNDVFGS